VSLQASILGVGVVANLGIGHQAFAQGFAATDTPSAIPALNPKDYMTLSTQCLDQASAIALICARLALDDAAIDTKAQQGTRIGLVLGTAYGNFSVIKDYATLKSPSPLRFVHSFINTPAGLVSKVLGVRGPHVLLCSGELAALQSIRYATWLLASHKADVVLCGGIDSVPSTTDQKVVQGGGGLLVLGKRLEYDNNPRLLAHASFVHKELYTVISKTLTQAAQRANCQLAKIDTIIIATESDQPSYSNIQQVMSQLGLSTAKWIDLNKRVGSVSAGIGGIGAVLSIILAEETDNPIVLLGIKEHECSCLIFASNNPPPLC